MAITLRINKGSELTFAELDQNFTDLDTRINTLEGVSNTDNQTLTLVGDNLSISGGNTVDLSGLGGSSYTDSDVDTHLNTGTATANQVLSWDGADYAWVADADSTEATSMVFTVHNNSGGVLTKGEVVYISGLNGNTPEVSKAQANSSTTMPAFGIVKDDIANTADGTVITFGSCPGHNAADFGETGITFGLGDTLYVSALEAGKLTNVAPAGELNLIQNIGKVERATPTTNMTLKVGGAGRTNATPALDEGNIFIGNAQNQSSTASFNSTVDAHLNQSNPTSGYVLSWNGSDYAWVAQSGGGGGIALGDLSVGAEDPASGDGGISYDNTTGVFTYAPPDLSLYQPVGNLNADIDSHLNTSTATANQILSWDGADYAWVADQTGGGSTSVTVQDTAPGSGSTGDLWWESDIGVLKIYYGGTWVDASPAGSGTGGIALTDLSVTVASEGSTNLAYDNTTGAFTYTPPDLSGYLTSYTETDTLDSVVGRGATTTTTAVIPFYYANQAAFPNATTYHGAIAHSHADGSMFFAHSGSWNRLANIADLDFNALTNQSDAYKVNIQSTSLAQDHYPLMHSANTGTGITPLVDSEYRYNPDTNTLSVHNVTVLTELTSPAINPVTDTVGAIGTELVINGGEATALNSQGGDLTLDAGAGANLPGEINLGVNSSNTGQINVGYSGSAVVVAGRTTFNGDVTLTTGTWETVNTSITTGAATVNVDCDSGHIVYLDASSGGFNSTFTINLVNLGNTSNVASAVTVIIKQPAGAGVLPNAIQIAGTGQTLLWQGGSAPTPNAGGNAHDVFTFSVLDLGATNVVLGQMVDYA